jgi:hypothetical protein
MCRPPVDVHMLAGGHARLRSIERPPRLCLHKHRLEAGLIKELFLSHPRQPLEGRLRFGPGPEFWIGLHDPNHLVVRRLAVDRHLRGVGVADADLADLDPGGPAPGSRRGRLRGRSRLVGGAAAAARQGEGGARDELRERFTSCGHLTPWR